MPTMRKNGWLQDPLTTNTKRFHRDEKSWGRYPKVFIDTGRPLPGNHALLKSRIHVDMNEATDLWHKLQKEGWQSVTPQWQADIDI